MSQPAVFTIILNTNRRDDTLACLASLAESTFANNTVLVLDNASTDGSIPAIRAAFPEVQIKELTENRGYAGNNNVGIDAALEQGAEWVFVLNEDTILDRNCLAEMVEVGERDRRIGIVGPMVYHHSAPDVIQSAGGVLGRYWDAIHLGRDEPDRGQFAAPHGVEWISGCGILVRRAAIEQAGAIDERFFYFWEETEWCIRIGRSGWKVIHVPAAKMWHKGVTIDHRPKPSVTYYAARNRLLTMAKHGAPAGVRFHAWVQIGRTLTSWSIKPRWRHMRDHRNALWHGLMDYLRGRWGQMPS